MVAVAANAVVVAVAAVISVIAAGLYVVVAASLLEAFVEILVVLAVVICFQQPLAP